MRGKSPGTGQSTMWYELLPPGQLETRSGSRGQISRGSRCAGSFRKSRATPFIGATLFLRTVGRPGASKRNWKLTGWDRQAEQDQGKFSMARTASPPWPNPGTPHRAFLTYAREQRGLRTTTSCSWSARRRCAPRTWPAWHAPIYTDPLVIDETSVRGEMGAGTTAIARMRADALTRAE